VMLASTPHRKTYFTSSVINKTGGGQNFFAGGASQGPISVFNHPLVRPSPSDIAIDAFECQSFQERMVMVMVYCFI